MAEPILEIRELSVQFQKAKKWLPLTHNIDLKIHAGETLALVGESGSGKSVTAMSILNLLPKNVRRTGQILFEGTDLVSASETSMRKVRGSAIATIFQEPMTALNPVYTIGRQLQEAVQSHRTITTGDARDLALELLQKVQMPNPEQKLKHYPHQLSGGQRQRAMIAMAISSEPRLLIADEPTTALDVTVQAEILDLLVDLQQRMGMGILMITHDMGVVADVAHRVAVMQNGRLVEEAPATELFTHPTEQYTRELLNAVPYLGRNQQDSKPTLPPTLTARNLVTTNDVLKFDRVSIEYPGSFRRKGFRAVSDISFSVAPGEIVGLVGESGSGKSTIGRAVVGLMDAAEGEITFNGETLKSMKGADARQFRRQVSMVFQDPASSLNPRATIGDSITAPLLWTRSETNGRRLKQRAREMLELVQIPSDWIDRYPHELSGGQRQRVSIARAIATDPLLMVADEPTSALDVSVQAKVLELFLELQRRIGFSCLFISHDLSVIEQLSNKVVVLRNGKIVEAGSTRDVLNNPREDYTQKLIAAAPVPDPEIQQVRRRARRSTTARPDLVGI
ncbi:ABC transporter ATP-binding protein [Paeniglutamicibacter sp. MACA_103]|uniref:ABC transporter ATP-binding protein n=1 Tax=Paeniglutamicibacter sp. MACA_103 TaxID=3377337 RepID=UPI0038935603